jgi:hypothetical protein
MPPIWMPMDEEIAKPPEREGRDEPRFSDSVRIFGHLGIRHELVQDGLEPDRSRDLVQSAPARP